MNEERLAAECDKYGLPHDLDALLRHIYANRDATYAAKDYGATLASARIAALEKSLSDEMDRNAANVARAGSRIAALEEAADGVVAWLRAGASRDADSLAVLEGHVWKLAPLVLDRQNTASVDHSEAQE